MEYPISFFLDMAWDPEQFNPHNLEEHTKEWLHNNLAQPIRKRLPVFSPYAKFNRRVTPKC